MKNLKKILAISVACLSLFLVACNKKAPENLVQEKILTKFTQTNSEYATITNESYPAEANGMTGELILSIGEADAPTEYILMYFFENASKAEAFLDNQENKDALISSQTGFNANGVSTTFGSHVNVVYLATSRALSTLKK